MDSAFGDMIAEGWLVIYMDNVLVFSKTQEECQERTKQVLKRMQEEDPHLKLAKYTFEMPLDSVPPPSPCGKAALPSALSLPLLAKHVCSASALCSICLSDIGRCYHSLLKGSLRLCYMPPSLPKFVLEFFVASPFSWSWTTRASPNKGKTLLIPHIPTHCSKLAHRAVHCTVDLFHSFKAHLSLVSLNSQGWVPLLFCASTTITCSSTSTVRWQVALAPLPRFLLLGLAQVTPPYHHHSSQDICCSSFCPPASFYPCILPFFGGAVLPPGRCSPAYCAGGRSHPATSIYLVPSPPPPVSAHVPPSSALLSAEQVSLCYHCVIDHLVCPVPLQNTLLMSDPIASAHPPEDASWVFCVEHWDTLPNHLEYFSLDCDLYMSSEHDGYFDATLWFWPLDNEAPDVDEVKFLI